MKATALFASTLVALLTTAPAVHAQAPVDGPLMRADLAGLIGWSHVNSRRVVEGSGLQNGGLEGAVTFGWYWTDHLKTQVRAGASTGRNMHVSGYTDIAGRRYSTSSEVSASSRQLSVSQLYQFGRNRLFHPYVGGGVSLVADRFSRRDFPVYSYDSVRRGPHVIRDATIQPLRTTTRMEALASAGCKTYMNRRAFLALDAAVGFGRRIETIGLQAGIGVDF